MKEKLQNNKKKTVTHLYTVQKMNKKNMIVWVVLRQIILKCTKYDNMYFFFERKKKMTNIYIYIHLHKHTALWSLGLLTFEQQGEYKVGRVSKSKQQEMLHFHLENTLRGKNPLS